MRTTLALILAGALSVGIGLLPGRERSGQSPQESGRTGKAFDGNWWLATDSDERSGFLNGAADCLVWAAHAKGFSATPEQLDKKITHYYAAHPADRKKLVTDVWRELETKSLPASVTPGAENWTNPHWYLDGLWWSQGAKQENVGYVEGYLWCWRTYLQTPSDTYSRPVSYYVEKISEYIRASAGADDEAVATILSRFGDQRKPKYVQPRPPRQAR